MKQVLSCREFSEQLVDYARQRTEPDASMSAHLAYCGACRERWEAERNLTSGLRLVRMRSLSAHTPPSVRESLLVEFAQVRRQPSRVRMISREWVWGLAAAATIVLSTVAVQRFVVSPVTPPVSLQSEAQTETQQEGFIEVPYAPPLAPGELIRVVHTELQPAALASLGVNVDPSWTAELPADLLVGQDGFPRAVRVSDEYTGSEGF